MSKLMNINNHMTLQLFVDHRPLDVFFKGDNKWNLQEGAADIVLTKSNAFPLLILNDYGITLVITEKEKVKGLL